MAGYAFSNISGAPGALPAWRFRIDFGVIPTRALVLAGGALSGHVALSVFCQQFMIVGGMVEPMEIALHGHVVMQRGRKNYSHSIQAMFIEPRGGVVSALLRGWQEVVVGTETGNSEVHREDYKRTVSVTTFDEVGNPALKQIVEGLYPQDVTDIQLDGQTSAPIMTNMTFSFDRAAMPELYSIEDYEQFTTGL